MCSDSWLQVSDTHNTNAHTDRHTNKYVHTSAQKAILKEGKVRENWGKTEKERAGSRPPSRTNEWTLLAHHNLLPLYGAYSKGASADLSKWAVKCYSMLNTFFSPVCFHTHILHNTRSPLLMKADAKNPRNKGNKRESLQCIVWAHCCYSLFWHSMLSHFCQYKLRLQIMITIIVNRFFNNLFTLFSALMPNSYIWEAGIRKCSTFSSAKYWLIYYYNFRLIFFQLTIN